MAPAMKTLVTIVFVAAADALLVVAALLFVAGHMWQAGVVFAVVLGVAAAAVWRCVRRSAVPARPTPPCGDEGCWAWHCPCCGGHSADVPEWHRLLNAVHTPTRRLGILSQPNWPEVHLIQPRPRPRYSNQDGV